MGVPSGAMHKPSRRITLRRILVGGLLGSLLGFYLWRTHGLAGSASEPASPSPPSKQSEASAAPHQTHTQVTRTTPPPSNPQDNAARSDSERAHELAVQLQAHPECPPRLRSALTRALAILAAEGSAAQAPTPGLDALEPSPNSQGPNGSPAEVPIPGVEVQEPSPQVQQPSGPTNEAPQPSLQRLG